MSGGQGDGIALGAEACDGGFDEVAGFEEFRRVCACADARGGAGGDDVAWEERHEAADVADEEGDWEDEVGGGALLAGVAVDGEGEVEGVGVTGFVGGDEDWAEGSEGVGAFALGPLAAEFFLPCAFADIVHDGEAGDVVEGVGFRDVSGFGADDDGEFDFPVGFGSAGVDEDGVEGAGPRGGSLLEEDGFGGDGGAGFEGVGAVVEADADDFGGSGDRWAPADVVGDAWCGGGAGVEPCAETVDAVVSEEGFVEVGGDGGGVDAFGADEDTWTFISRGTVSDQSHVDRCCGGIMGATIKANQP